MKRSMYTALLLVAVLVLLSCLPRFLGEGFLSGMRESHTLQGTKLGQRYMGPAYPQTQPGFLDGAKTSVTQEACLSSNLSTSTGCLVPTQEQLVSLETRGGNKAPYSSM